MLEALTKTRPISKIKNTMDNDEAIGFGTTDVDSSEGFEQEMSEPNEKSISEVTSREKFNVWVDYIGKRVPLLNFL
jgi:hypothetical protein